MPEKTKPRGATAKPRRDRSRTPIRAQPRHSKQSSLRTPAKPSSKHLRTPDATASSAEDGGGASPADGAVEEPLDVENLLAELLDRVMSECALAAAARQRVPFTVSRARDAILCVAEWRFLVRDEGDPDHEGDPGPERDGVWSEDEEPQTCPWDSWAQVAATGQDVPESPGQVKRSLTPLEPAQGRGTRDVTPTGSPLTPGQVPCQDLPVPAEAEDPLVCPNRVPDAVPLPPGQVPAAKPPCQEPPVAAGAPPAQVPGAVAVPLVPGPPGPQPPIASRPPRRDPRLARPPRPRPAPPCPPRPPAPCPAKPPEPPAQGPWGSREATAGVGGQVPPPPSSSSRTSLGSLQPRRPSRGPGAARGPISGVPRLGARRGVTRWVLPEVKVLDVPTEPELSRGHRGGSRGRLLPRGSLQVLPGPSRPPKAEPQLCDPWLASARLAPGVTVRCGGSERRGPGTAGEEEEEEEEEEKELKGVRKAERELRPIRRYPVCLMSEEGEW